MAPDAHHHLVRLRQRLANTRAPAARSARSLPFYQRLQSGTCCHSAKTFHQNDSYTQVNPRTEQWVTGRMAELGYTIDVAASRGLRSAAQLPWFKSNLFVLRRNASLLRDRERARISRTASGPAAASAALFQKGLLAVNGKLA